MKNKILIIGGSGLVGSTLTSYAHSNYNLHLTVNNNEFKKNNIPTTRIDLINQRDAIIDLIKDFKPNIVVHTAAFSSVDYCETNPKMATMLHVDITSDIVKICKLIDSKLIYFSTDAVFDGKLNRKYNEEDKPNPLSHYGKTKLEAEKIILEDSHNNIVLRTTVIYGSHKRSRFTNWVLDLLRNRQIVQAYTDQHNTPTLVDDLVKAILKMIENNESGLYHATGNTCLSRYEFAIKLAEKYGLSKDLIIPVTSTQKKQDAPRPVNGCLDSSKLEKLLNYNFCNIKEGIEFIHNNNNLEKL